MSTFLKKHTNLFIKIFLVLWFSVLFIGNFFENIDTQNLYLINSSIAYHFFGLILTVLVAPVYETMIWQSWLIGQDKPSFINYKLLFPLGIIKSISNQFFFKNIYSLSDSIISWELKYLIVFLYQASFIGLYFMLDKLYKNNISFRNTLDTVVTFLQKHLWFGIFVSLAIATFGHQILRFNDLFDFLKIGAYFILFGIDATVRLRFGLIAAILTHALHNTILSVWLFLRYANFDQLVYLYQSLFILLVFEIILLLNLKKLKKIIDLP